MAYKHKIIPRDISWLSFNARVLQEAADPTVPLRERIRFLWYRFRMSMREMNYATSVMLMPTFLGDVGGSWVILRNTDVSSGTAVDDER